MSLDQPLDIVFVLDPGAPPGGSAGEPRLALFRAEIAAALAAGLRCGLLALWDAEAGGGQRCDPWIGARLQGGDLVQVRPGGQARCQTALVLDAEAFAQLPAVPCPLTAASILVAPPVRLPPLQRAPYEALRARALKIIEAYFQAPVLACALTGTPDQPAYLPLIPSADIAGSPRPAPLGSAILGIDGTALQAQPDDLALALEAALEALPNLVLRAWGPAEGLPEALPTNPRCLRCEASAGSAAAFFPALDFHAAPPAARHSTALLLPAVLAMARGAVVLAPSCLEPLLGEGALYLGWDELTPTIAALMKDPDAYARQSRAAVRTARKRFNAGLWLARFQGYRAAAGPASGEAHDNPAAPPLVTSGSREGVLMISSNGVGLGHVTRLLAVARRLPQRFEPRFLTLSEGVGLIGTQGFGADYIPSFARLDLDRESWNRLLARRIARFIQIYAPRAAVFDGNHPYSGLLDVISATPEIAWFWVRRPLWKRHRDLEALERWRFFDAVIEPRDLCGGEDVGPTTLARESVIEVPPPLFLKPDERLPREAARQELGLRDGETCVAIQLGAGSNFDFAAIRTALLADLRQRPGLRLFELHSPITNLALRTPEAGVQPLAAYPSARLSAGFDLLISSAGYNTFHECLCYGTPALFVPNESHEMDDQLLRARYASALGAALTLRASEAWRVREALNAALSEAFRSQASQRAATATAGLGDGAAEIARIIEDAAGALRTGRPLGDGINRI